MITITQASDLNTVRDLMRTYSESVGLDLSFQNFEEELATLDTFYQDILLAMLGERVVGCVALRKIDEMTCEMKRLYVRPLFRKQGAGHALIQCVIEAARNRGFDRMRLDTLPTMGDAARLYASFGFRDIDPYRENPVPGARFLELSLQGDAMPVGLLVDSPDLTEWEWGDESGSESGGESQS